MSYLPARSDLLPTSQIQLPRIPVNCITSRVGASGLKIQHIIDATNKDDTLILWIHTVNNGWTKTIQEFSECIHLYWDFHEQIITENGLLLKKLKDNYSKLTTTRISGTDTWRTPWTWEMLILSPLYSLLAKYTEGFKREVEVMLIMAEVCQSQPKETTGQNSTTGTRGTSTPMDQVSQWYLPLQWNRLHTSYWLHVKILCQH